LGQARIFQSVARTEKDQEQRPTQQEFTDKRLVQEQAKRRATGTAIRTYLFVEAASQCLEFTPETAKR